IAHNLTSALDNLVFELAEINPNPPSGPTSDAERKRHRGLLRSQGFPFCKEPSNWKGDLVSRLHFVDSALYAFFEETQPFYARQKHGIDPDYFPLAVLHDLWTRDKHRSVNLTTAGLQFNFT